MASTDRSTSSAATPLAEQVILGWRERRPVLDSLAAEQEVVAAAYERATEQRENLLARLAADPDRSAIATLDGLGKMLPELKVEEDEQIGAILDWSGVAGDDDLSLAERVRILALEHATKQGYSLEEAERLCP